MPAVLFGDGRGLMRSSRIPSRSHQTESLLRSYSACAEAKGTQLSVRMPCGRPNSWKARSNTPKAYRSLVVDKASHARRYRLAKSVIVSEQ